MNNLENEIKSKIVTTKGFVFNFGKDTEIATIEAINIGIKLGIDDLVNQLKKRAKWRTEEHMSTEIEDGCETTRFRTRQYVRLDTVLVLLQK